MTVRIPSVDTSTYATTTPIEHFEPRFSIGAYNALKRVGIHYVEQITQMTRTDLAEIPNLDERKLDEIIDKLNSKGYELVAD